MRYKNLLLVTTGVIALTSVTQAYACPANPDTFTLAPGQSHTFTNPEKTLITCSGSVSGGSYQDPAPIGIQMYNGDNKPMTGDWKFSNKPECQSYTSGFCIYLVDGNWATYQAPSASADAIPATVVLTNNAQNPVPVRITCAAS